MTLSLAQDIKGILFDLDGTLYRMKWYMRPLLTLKLFPRSLLLPRYMNVRKIFAGRDMKTGDALMRAMALQLAGTVRNADPDLMLSWIQNDFYPAFNAIMPRFRGARPGLDETLLSLKQKGYKLAVLSDFAHVKERLTGLDINPVLFDVILSSETEGALKPHIRPFLTIAQSLHMHPADILVIGDRKDTDQAAALACGMYFMHITDKKRVPSHSYPWRSIREHLNSLKHIS
jgi:FMN phosphatase YigB (HAD superfamily)